MEPGGGQDAAAKNNMFADIPYGIANRFRLRALRAVPDHVSAYAARASDARNEELRQTAALMRRRLAHGETLDDLLPEVFAIVCEAASRQVGMRPFEVQVLGAAAMHRGWIVEMQAGEGKTLTVTMTASLNALLGRGVHIVTVNDYLARRDAEWMGPIYKALGLSVGCLVHGLSEEARMDAYRADITYGTNKEFAFDYLRDRLRLHRPQNGLAEGVFESHRLSSAAGASRLQREHHFAVLDEIDSILIDEARVPLIISDREGVESPYTPAYSAARELALQLKEGGDFILESAQRKVELTTQGIALARQAAAARLPPNRPFEHLVEQALRAEHLFLRDREYLVDEGKVAIVDEFTGRILPDRTWSLGLHQAIEVKEGLIVTEENRTLASVTFQRYFRGYRKLTGMTGTAVDAAAEFRKLFGLAVVTIPTNRPLRRKALRTRVVTTWEDKHAAIVARVAQLREAGRPVLVGTRSVRRSEALSLVLTQQGIPHNVLNARNHEIEAQLIAQAGSRGKVTIATNMAGRGVDIKLEPGVAAMGGLHVLATELHEARRIDRQLAGRAGRQGDPGTYEFYLCLEDDVLSRWNKWLATWLLNRARGRGCGPVSPLAVLLFRVAQRWIEHRHLRMRLELVEYDKKLEEMKGTLGSPVWG
jgi:preprotein translocase subunit SecA